MLASRSFAEIEQAHRIDPEACFEAMLDSPSNRRHLIAQGLWLGNQVRGSAGDSLNCESLD